MSATVVPFATARAQLSPQQRITAALREAVQPLIGQSNTPAAQLALRQAVTECTREFFGRLGSEIEIIEQGPDRLRVRIFTSQDVDLIP
jgi:hypothetical protein